MDKTNKILLWILALIIGALIIVNVSFWIDNSNLKRKVKNQNEKIERQTLNQIEKDQEHFDSIQKLNYTIDLLLLNNAEELAETDQRINQNTKNYEKAVRDLDTIHDTATLQRILTGIFEEN